MIGCGAHVTKEGPVLLLYSFLQRTNQGPTKIALILSESHFIATWPHLFQVPAPPASTLRIMLLYTKDHASSKGTCGGTKSARVQSFVQVTIRGGSRARWRDHFKGGQREESLTDSERENLLHRAGSGAGGGRGVCQ